MCTAPERPSTYSNEGIDISTASTLMPLQKTNDNPEAALTPPTKNNIMVILKLRKQSHESPTPSNTENPTRRTSVI